MYEAIAANRRRSAALVAALVALLAGTGFALGEAFEPGAGALGTGGGLLVGAVLSLSAWGGGDRFLLASAGAHPATREAQPQLTNVVEEIALAAGLPAPRVYVVDDPAPNAFATGRSPEHASIAVTTGLLERLDRAELQGVVAHELGHVQNRDTLFMTLAAALAGAVVVLADLAWQAARFGGRPRGGRDRDRAAGLFLVALVLMVVAVPLARLLRMAASREREYLADATAALLTRYPAGLAGALEKIEAAPVRLRVNEAVAPLCVVNPRQLGGDGGGWLASHPPTARRVAVLRAMGSGAGYAAYERAFAQVTAGGRLLPPSARAAAGGG